jgi:drug/metabolite transporter (DMT)-like permease
MPSIKSEKHIPAASGQIGDIGISSSAAGGNFGLSCVFYWDRCMGTPTRGGGTGGRQTERPDGTDMQNDGMKHYLAVSGLLLAMVLWGSSFVALKVAFRAYDPMVVIFGRMAVASICFLMLGRWIVSSVRLRWGDFKYIMIMALCEPCLYYLFEAHAIERTTASQAGMITAMFPVLVALAAGWLLKESVGPNTWLGSVMAVVGVCWLTFEAESSASAPDPVMGNFLEFLAMICAAGYTITLKRLTRIYSPFFLTAMQAFAGSVFYLPLVFLPSTRLPVHFEMAPGMAIIYLGAVITLGAYGLFNFGLKHIPAHQASAYVNLIPVFSVIMGWMLLDESLTGTQYLAALLIMAGVYVGQRRKYRFQ